MVYRNATQLLWENKFSDIMVHGFRDGDFVVKYDKSKNLCHGIYDVFEMLEIPFKSNGPEDFWDMTGVNLNDAKEREGFNLCGLNIMEEFALNVEFLVG